MSELDRLATDIEKVKQIPIVDTILQVINQTTGMGFSAVARVTKDRWIACVVNDEIQFGLKSGGELKVETTICNEIRDNHKAVIIDHVAKDPLFHNHHTPLMYGFQSYISVPIFLKNGEFFGTLCAIDPNPAELNNPKVIGMFNLFAELISFHLQTVDLMEKSNSALIDMSRQLTDSSDENRQYQHISTHNLQEPLRKIRLFSNMLINATAAKDAERANDLALKVSASAQRISMMIKDLSGFSDLNYTDESFENIDLYKVVSDVCAQLSSSLEAKEGRIEIQSLPVVHGIPFQMEQLFFHLINNAIKFSQPGVAPHIKIYSKPIDDDQKVKGVSGFEIFIEDNGLGIEQSQLTKIFDIFSKLAIDQPSEGFGMGLAYCRKIIRNHGGQINAQSEFGNGTTFSILLPTEGNKAHIDYLVSQQVI